MATKIVDIHEARANLAELTSLANAGTEVILAEAGAPVARIVPVAVASASRTAGLHPQSIQTEDDFDEPLPDSFWSGAL